MSRSIILAGFAVAAALATPALAQDASSSSAMASASAMSSSSQSAQDIPALNVTDPQTFANKATVANMFEIQSSQLAVKTTQNADIRNFAQRMIDDHTKAAADMKTAASAQGDISLPTQLDQDNMDKLQQLQSAGDNFDRLYVQMQTDAHVQAVGLFKGYAQGGPDGALKDFASKTEPVLEQHYDMVIKLPH